MTPTVLGHRNSVLELSGKLIQTQPEHRHKITRRAFFIIFTAKIECAKMCVVKFKKKSTS